MEFLKFKGSWMSNPHTIPWLKKEGKKHLSQEQRSVITSFLKSSEHAQRRSVMEGPLFLRQSLEAMTVVVGELQQAVWKEEQNQLALSGALWCISCMEHGHTFRECDRRDEVGRESPRRGPPKRVVKSRTSPACSVVAPFGKGENGTGRLPKQPEGERKSAAKCASLEAQLEAAMKLIESQDKELECQKRVCTDLEDESVKTQRRASIMEDRWRVTLQEVQELQKKLATAEREKQQAQQERDGLQIESKVQVGKSAQIVKDKRRLEARITQLEEELAKEQRTTALAHDSLKSAQRQTDQLEVALTEERSISQRLEGACSQLDQQRCRSEQEVASLKRKVESLNSLVTDLQTDIQNSQVRETELLGSTEKLTRENAQLWSESNGRQTQLDIVMASASKLETRLQESERAVKDLMGRLQTERQQRQGDAQTLQESVKAVTNLTNQLQTEKQQRQNDAQMMQVSERALTVLAEQLQMEKQQRQDDAQMLQQERATRRTETAQLKTSVAQLKKELFQAQEKLDQVEEKSRDQEAQHQATELSFCEVLKIQTEMLLQVQGQLEQVSVKPVLVLFEVSTQVEVFQPVEPAGDDDQPVEPARDDDRTVESECGRWSPIPLSLRDLIKGLEEQQLEEELWWDEGQEEGLGSLTEKDWVNTQPPPDMVSPTPPLRSVRRMEKSRRKGRGKKQRTHLGKSANVKNKSEGKSNYLKSLSSPVMVPRHVKEEWRRERRTKRGPRSNKLHKVPGPDQTKVVKPRTWLCIVTRSMEPRASNHMWPVWSRRGEELAPFAKLSQVHSQETYGQEENWTFDPGGALPEWAWRGRPSVVALGRGPLSPHEVRAEEEGVWQPRGRPRKWLPESWGPVGLQGQKDYNTQQPVVPIPATSWIESLVWEGRHLMPIMDPLK